MRNIILFAVVLGLTGCASSPTKTPAPTQATINAPAAPTYSEKVSNVPLSMMKTSAQCPVSNAGFEGLDWRKVVPMANACVKASDWRKVETLGNYLAMKAPLTPWGAYYLSLAASSRRDYARASWMLELALKKNPNEGLFHYELSRIHWELGSEEQARVHLKMASDMSPSLTPAHWTLGQLAIDRGDYKEAERRLKMALQSDSRHWPTLMSFAALKMKTKDWEEAEEYLTKAVATNPRSTKARVALATVQEKNLSKFHEAIAQYKEIRSLSAARKLDEPAPTDVESRIKDLEKNLPQVTKQQVTTDKREPSGERKVSQ